MDYKIEILEKEKYSESIKIIKSPPKKLYYKGNINLIYENRIISVVGSRKNTDYARKVIEKFVKELVEEGFIIVSGLSIGVDSLVHENALINKGKTIAVLPCGIDTVYPARNYYLYKEIIDSGGLIISEYEGQEGIAKWTYIQRNRIIAGLSKALLIIEARRSSGSLTTADFAKRNNRKIFVVPGSIFNENSLGGLSLISSGAVVVTSVEDVLINLNYKVKTVTIENRRNVLKEEYLTEEEKKLINSISIEGISINDLCLVTQYKVSELLQKLSFLVIKGLIREEEGRYYVN